MGCGLVPLERRVSRDLCRHGNKFTRMGAKYLKILGALIMDPDAPGPIYTAEQIKIPAELPDLLKEFTKAAIRTQPPDLLQWSAA